MSKPFRERNPVIIGAISLAVIAVMILAAFRAQDLPIIGGGDTYTAAFTEAGGLKVDDPVRIAGVRVGKVEGISLEGDHVKVTFRVKTDSQFGDETAASIRVSTLLGAMYLALEPAGTGQLDAGKEIPVERTQSPYDVVEAFSGLAETADQIDTDQLAQSLTTLADLTRNTPEEFRAALSGVSRLSSDIAAKNGRINLLLTNLQRVSSVLNDRDQDIVDLMKQSDSLFQALVARRQAVHDILVSTSSLSTELSALVQRREAVHNLLVSTSTLSKELTALVQQSRADLKPALTHLDSVVQVLNKNEDNLDNSLRLMAPFYRVFANTLGDGPWFDTYIQNMPPAPDVTNGGGVG
jgi:phospholipid/cholesterol/gamma-HCH transport system substrate-binding protein